MAKPSQTFKKRQREHKLRERAQLKLQRREQRRAEKKLGVKSEDLGPVLTAPRPALADDLPGDFLTPAS